jgi:hypothetical protein
MRLDEFDAFRSEMLQLCASLGKKYTDALGQAYWRALKDVSLDEIQAHVERILLSATSETKFPKPMQLRSTAPKSRAVANSPEMLEIDRKAATGLEELRKENLPEWFRLMKGKGAEALVRHFGNDNVFFDPGDMCWKRVPS